MLKMTSGVFAATSPDTGGVCSPPVDHAIGPPSHAPSMVGGAAPPSSMAPKGFLDMPQHPLHATAQSGYHCLQQAPTNPYGPPGHHQTGPGAGVMHPHLQGFHPPPGHSPGMHQMGPGGVPVSRPMHASPYGAHTAYVNPTTGPSPQPATPYYSLNHFAPAGPLSAGGRTEGEFPRRFSKIF